MVLNRFPATASSPSLLEVLDVTDPLNCGPACAIASEGVVLAHNLVTGTDAKVDTSALVPGIGLPSIAFGSDVVDGWFS